MFSRPPTCEEPGTKRSEFVGQKVVAVRVSSAELILNVPRCCEVLSETDFPQSHTVDASAPFCERFDPVMRCGGNDGQHRSDRGWNKSHKSPHRSSVSVRHFGVGTDGSVDKKRRLSGSQLLRDLLFAFFASWFAYPVVHYSQVDVIQIFTWASPYHT